jgi:MFS family permease
MVGIPLARTISGLLAGAFGWRGIYVAAAILMIVMAGILARAIPAEPARPAVPYGKFLASVFAIVRQHRSAQVTLILGATTFAVFWTGLTFLLSSPPLSYSASQIGLVGLLGFAGALTAQRARRLHDKGWSIGAMGAGGQGHRGHDRQWGRCRIGQHRGRSAGRLGRDGLSTGHLGQARHALQEAGIQPALTTRPIAIDRIGRGLA